MFLQGWEEWECSCGELYMFKFRGKQLKTFKIQAYDLQFSIYFLMQWNKDVLILQKHVASGHTCSHNVPVSYLLLAATDLCASVVKYWNTQTSQTIPACIWPLVTLNETDRMLSLFLYCLIKVDWGMKLHVGHTLRVFTLYLSLKCLFTSRFRMPVCVFWLNLLLCLEERRFGLLTLSGSEMKCCFFHLLSAPLGKHYSLEIPVKVKVTFTGFLLSFISSRLCF